MSNEYADSIWPITKLIPRRYNYVTNSVIRPVHYYNGNSFLIPPIQYIWGAADSGGLVFEHSNATSRLNRMRNVEIVASAEALPTELRSRTLGTPRISMTTGTLAI